MSYYGIGEKFKVKRLSGGRLELGIGQEKVTVLVEDLAALVRDNLSESRAAEMFSEIQEKLVTKGKAMVNVKAKKDIKKGDIVSFVIDVTKYVNSGGVRVTKSGIIF